MNEQDDLMDLMFIQDANHMRLAHGGALLWGVITQLFDGALGPLSSFKYFRIITFIHGLHLCLQGLHNTCCLTF